MEDTIKLIQKIQNKTDKSKNLEELYRSQINFIHYLGKSYNVPLNYYDDYLQLSYIALEKAVHSYRCDSGNSFSYYYSRFIKHEYYEYYLKMCFPTRIPHKFFSNYKNTKHILLEKGLPLEYFYDEYILEYTSFEEYSELKVELWTTIHSNVSDLNFYIIKERFINERTLESIGNEIGIGKDRVRLRILRCFKKLRNNEKLKELAADYFDII